MTALVEACGVTKVFGQGATDFSALNGISLKVEAGQSLAIVGASGSGKSTLLNLLGLLDVPTTGRVLIDGEDTTGFAERRKDRIRNQDFGFVFQDSRVDPLATVEDNVAMPLLIAGKHGSARERIGDMLSKVGLEQWRKRRAGLLSGGQKQRVAIARALINGPRVVLADEPTGALDSRTGASVADLMFEKNRTDGVTLVVVTHNLDMARRCDEAVEIVDGRICAEVPTVKVGAS